MRTKVTLVLLFLNVALFFYIFEVEHRLRGDEAFKVARANVLGAEAADIRGIEVTGGTRPLALAKRGDIWFVTQPLEWPANPAAVSRILTELQFLKHETSFSVADLAKSGQSLADYGLDQPRLTVTITSGDPASPSLSSQATRVTKLRIGDATKDGLRLYLLSPDGERIHVVNRSLARTFLLTVDDLRADALFTIQVFEARSLNLQTAAPANLRIRLRRDGTRWSFETPIVARASKTATELAINGLNALRVDTFITANPPTTLPVDRASLRISLEGNNRREILVLGDPVPAAANELRDPAFQLCYAQLEGRNTLFTVSIPNKLMETLRTAQVSLREKRVLDFDPATVSTLTLTAATRPELSLQRLDASAGADGAAWQIVRRGDASLGPQTQPADRATVQRHLDDLMRLSAIDFKSDAPSAADLESWGFNRPELEVTLTFPPGGAAPITLQLGTDTSRNVYARLGPSSNPGLSVYAVDASILHELSVAPRDWREHLIRELPAGARLTALKLTDLANQQVLLDTAIDASGHPAASTPHPEAVAVLLAQLRSLTAKAFILDQYADRVAVAGEERPWRYRLEATATLVGGAGEQTNVTTLFLTGRVGGDLQVAGSPPNEFNAVFSIAQPLLDALWTFTEGPHDPGPPAPSADSGK